MSEPRVWRVEVADNLPAPRKETWDFATSPKNWPEFWPGLKSVGEPTGGPWPSAGSEIDVVLHIAGVTRDVHMHCEKAIPGQMLRYSSSQKGLPNAEFELHYADLAERTRYRICIEFTPRSGVVGLYDRYFVPMLVRRALRQTLRNLTAALDRRTGERRAGRDRRGRP